MTTNPGPSTADTLDERRRNAVGLRLAGKSLSEIGKATGLSAPAAIAAHKRFLAGGWEAVAIGPAGRKAGEGRLLAPQQEAEAFLQVITSTPDALGLPHGLWQSTVVQALLERRMGIKLTARSVANYLHRWGLSAPRPFARLKTGQGPIAKWRDTVYPDIVLRAQAEGASIWWVDELGVPTPTGCASWGTCRRG